MSVKEEIIDKTVVIKDLKQDHQNTTEIIKDDISERRFFRKIKRKYRLILIYLFFLLVILVFMILPIVIAAITQGLWW